MRSDEILKQAANRVGVKALAADMKLSPALIYKWCQPWDPTDPDSSGVRNPLDRVAEIVRITGEHEVVTWLCNQVGGFFTPNPRVDGKHLSTDLLRGAQQLVKEFSDMLEEVSVSVTNDGAIQPDEAARIRRHWETLKRVAEHFVVSSEMGMYQNDAAPATK